MKHAVHMMKKADVKAMMEGHRPAAKPMKKGKKAAPKQTKR